jgi:glycerol-3-phosphate cytidylyltransferase
VKKTELTKTPLEMEFETFLIKNTAIRLKGAQIMKRVITYGTFDLLHYGHINLLRRAKALGDYLIVVISSDEFNWNEKHKKCYFTYEQRKMLVESVRYVDLVIPEESWEQKRKDMHEYHIDTFVMGDDWKGKFDFLKEEGVEVVYLPRTPEISSSQIKQDLNVAGNVEKSKTNHDDIITNPGK